MENFDLSPDEEFIELNNLMKILNWVNSGGEAKTRIDLGEVQVNEIVETRRRRKLRRGDIIVFGKEEALIN